MDSSWFLQNHRNNQPEVPPKSGSPTHRGLQKAERRISRSLTPTPDKVPCGRGPGAEFGSHATVPVAAIPIAVDDELGISKMLFSRKMWGYE